MTRVWLLRRLQADVITFSSSISLCEKAAQWEEALQLLQQACKTVQAGLDVESLWNACRLHSLNVQADVIMFNAAISALEKAGQWQAVLVVLEEMSAREIQRDLITANAAESVDSSCFGTSPCVPIALCRSAGRQRLRLLLVLVRRLASGKPVLSISVSFLSTSFHPSVKDLLVGDVPGAV